MLTVLQRTYYLQDACGLVWTLHGAHKKFYMELTQSMPHLHNRQNEYRLGRGQCADLAAWTWPACYRVAGMMPMPAM